MSSTIPIGDATLRSLAEASGVCVRPVMRVLTDRLTQTTTAVAIACGSTRESKCPPCATKAKRLRAHQCSEGWHLTEDPLRPPADLDDDQVEDVDDPDKHAEGKDDASGGLDVDQDHDDDSARRTRSTRRRSDAMDLPKLPAEHRTVGASFTGRDGKTYRPSMFVTLTLPSYGRIVPGRGTPADPSSYDYRRAALDALHFPKLVDRWWQNLRRCAGYKVQYFAAVEPQRRLAPHLHAAIRGAIPRTTLRAVTKATYLQLWWPPFDEAVYTDQTPVWDAAAGRYRDPDTGWPLPTWDQALDRLDLDDKAEPAHVMRFGTQVDAQGIIAPSADADRAVRYLTKYLTKAVSQTYADPDDPDAAYEAHIDRLHAQVRWLPCSPACANWLRYGITPDDPGPGLTPGGCPAKAHDRECLGLGGRRVLVSRHWTGKTLTDHRADRAAVVHQALQAAGIEAPDARRCAADVLAEDGKPRFVWADVAAHEDAYDYAAVIASAVAQAKRWREQYDHAKAMAKQRGSPPGDPVDSHSATATGEAA